MTYLFHPYLVANCGARITTVLSNLLLVSFLLATVHKRRTAACLALALATFQQFYPVMLLFPLCATLALDEKTGRTINNALGEAAKAVVTFVVAFAGLNMASYHIMGNSWNFVLSTHGFTLGKMTSILTDLEKLTEIRSNIKLWRTLTNSGKIGHFF